MSAMTPLEQAREALGRARKFCQDIEDLPQGQEGNAGAERYASDAIDEIDHALAALDRSPWIAVEMEKPGKEPMDIVIQSDSGRNQLWHWQGHTDELPTSIVRWMPIPPKP